MAQLTVRIDDELKDQLEKLAHREGKTMSDVVRDLITAYVQDRDRSNAGAADMTRGDVAEAIVNVRSGET